MFLRRNALYATLGLSSALAARPHEAMAQPVAQPSQPVAQPSQPAAQPPEPAPYWPPAQQLRGLPVCAPGTPFPRPGIEFPCRWPLTTDGPEFSLGVGLGPGYVRSDQGTTGSLFAFEVPADLYLTRGFGLGLRYRYLHGQTEGSAESLTLHTASIGPRFRWFNDEGAREAWLFEPEVGYGFVGAGRDHGGLFVSLTVARQMGSFISDGGSANGALGATILQGLGDLADLRAVLVTVRLNPGVNAHAPRDLERPSQAASFHYTFGARWFMVGARFGDHGAFGLSPGMALTFGLPVARWLEPMAQVDMAYIQPLSRDVSSPLAYAALAGLRVRMNGVAPLYLDALAGWQFVTGRSPRDFEDGALFDVGFGLNGVGCGGGVQVGLHYRQGLTAGDEDYRALFFVVGGQYGSRGGSLGEGPLDHTSRWRCGAPSRPRVPMPPPPPPPRPPPPPPPPPTVYAPRVDVQVPAPRVQVVVEPVEVSVVIGASLFGGMMEFHLDPSALPIARLQQSGFVTVRVEGPAQALPQAEMELQGALSSQGVAVQGFARVVVPDATTVRAVFTLWPPGSRPR